MCNVSVIVQKVGVARLLAKESLNVWDIAQPTQIPKRNYKSIYLHENNSYFTRIYMKLLGVKVGLYSAIMQINIAKKATCNRNTKVLLKQG